MFLRQTEAIIGATIVLFVGVVFFWAFAGRDRTLSASITEVTDKAVIDRSVAISGVGIMTGENFVGHKIRIINGTIHNNSEKPLRLVEMKMVFTDYKGNAIHQSVERGFELTQKPLAPGGTYRFTVNFENLPPTWNYHIPNIAVVKIAF